MKKKILILGSNSFSGNHLARYLLDKKYFVIGCSLSDQSKPKFNSLMQVSKKNRSNFKFEKVNINKNLNKIKKIASTYKPSIIIDFLGQGMVAESWEHPFLTFNTNVLSKIKLYNFLSRQKYLKKYIKISTPEVFGSAKIKNSNFKKYNPSTPYALSHSTIENYLLLLFNQFSFPVIITRFANFYGPYQQLYRIVPKTFLCALTSQTLPLHGGGLSVRAFIHGFDVAEGIIKLIEKATPGSVFHFSTDKFFSIRDVVSKICTIAKVDPETFVKVSEDRVGKDQAYLMSSEKAKKVLGWSPNYSFDDGLKDCYRWIKDHFDDLKTLSRDYEHKQ